MFIYGTAWKEERTAPLVGMALSAGFRAFDTANQRKHYFEAAVGEALSFSEIPRAELWLQTKFTHIDGQDHRLPYDEKADPETQVAQSFASSLEHLHTDYIDSYVLHGPSQNDGFSDEDLRIWRAMSALHKSGKARALGVSNVNLSHVKPVAGEISFVQNRCYARTGWDKEMRAFCREHKIVYQGFSLLTANRRELSHPKITAIAAHHKATVAQIVFAFSLQVGMAPLTGTSSPEHARQDLAAEKLQLSDEDIATVENIAFTG
jgi:diketogulonate reductase-like aldo/keto reductase